MRSVGIVTAVASVVIYSSYGIVHQSALSDPKVILKKTTDLYSAAKSYRSKWTYTQDRAGKLIKLTNEVKSKGNQKLYFHVYSEDQNASQGVDSIPEVLAVIDGKTAWFEAPADKIYYKVELPKGATISPFLFFPNLNPTKDLAKRPDGQLKGKSAYVILTSSGSDTASQVIIDQDNFHILQFVTVSTSTGAASTTTITIDKEEFDVDIPDKEFTYKPKKGFKEVPAPPEAAALFGKAG